MNMTIPQINADIKNTVNKKYRKLACVCITWMLATTIIWILFLHRYFSEQMQPINSIILCAFLCVIPIFAMGGHKMLFDRSWYGTVIDIRYEREVRANASSHRKITYQNVAKLTVQTDNDIIIYCLPHTKLYFKPGDIICRFRGTTYPIYAVPPDNSTQICPICGSRVEQGHDKCFFCGHSVITCESLNYNR